MLVRYYDRPLERDKSVIPELDPDSWIFQAKEDGWFTFLVKDDSRTIANPEWGKGIKQNLFFLSRREKASGGPTQIPVSNEIVDIVQALNLPDKTMIACEWMARRTAGEIAETLFAHDLLWYNDQWAGKIPAIERWKTVNDLIGSTFSLTGINKAVVVPLSGNSGMDFFELLQKIPHTEGMVCKRKTGLLKGLADKGVDNPLIVKIKWRSGSSGRTEV